MIEFYKTGPEGTKLIDAPTPGCWVNVVSPTEEDRAWLNDKAGIVPEFVHSALDDEESSHIDFDDDTLQVLVIVDCAALEDASDLEDPSITQYDTQPLSVLLLPESSMIVTVSLSQNTTINAFAAGRVRGLDTRRSTRFLLQLLLNVAQTYQTYLRNINRQFTRTEKQLRRSLRNEELIKMLGLEKSLVYLSTSLKADEVTMGKIRTGRTIRLYEEDQELLDDVIIELRQAIEMATISTTILNGTMEVFGSVISNNLNNVMRTLTIITVILAIPNIIFSFYGMNVDNLPVAFTFLFPTALAFVISLAVALIIVKAKLFK